jgi:hypothetical protein
MGVALPIFGQPGLALSFDVRGDYRNPFELDAPELVQWIEGKPPRAIGNWRELSSEEYARSFTAARTAGYDVVRDLYDGYTATLRQPGATREDFASQLLPIMRAKGWLPDLNDQQMSRRLFLIFDTNLRLSQATGRWQRIQRTKLALPYLLAHTARDNRVRRPPKSRHDHTAFEGILLPVDHPFWISYFPPLGFNCRCAVVQKSRGQVARLALAVTGEADLAQRAARIGEPFGFQPGRPALASLEEAVEETNAARLEGAPPIEPQRIYAQARLRWASMSAMSAQAAVEGLIRRIFG